MLTVILQVGGHGDQAPDGSRISSKLSSRVGGENPAGAYTNTSPLPAVEGHLHPPGGQLLAAHVDRDLRSGRGQRRRQVGHAERLSKGGAEGAAGDRADR